MLHFDLPNKITHFTHFQSIDFHKLYFVWKLMTWESIICKVSLENLPNCALLFATYSCEAEMRICGFSWLFPRSFNIFKIFLHILIGNVKGFHKMYDKPYFDQNKLCTVFYYISLLRKKWLSFCKFANFFADSFRGAWALSKKCITCYIWHSNFGNRGVGPTWPPWPIQGFPTSAKIGVNFFFKVCVRVKFTCH